MFGINPGSLSSYKLGLRWKLVIPFILVTVAAITILLPFTRRLVASRIEAEADRQLIEVADSVGALIENSEKQARLSAAFVANLPEVSAAFASPEALAEVFAARTADLELQELSLYAADFAAGDAALYYGGPLVARRFQESAHTQDIRDSLLLTAVATGRPVSGIAIAPQSSQIIGVAPLYGMMGAEDENVIKGVILAAVYMDEAYIEELSGIIGADIAIVSENAVIVTTIDRASGFELMLQQGFIDPQADYNAANVTYGDGTQYRLLEQTLLIAGFPQGSLLVAEPIEELSQLNRNVQAVIAAFALFFVFTILLVGFLSALYFSRPLATLAEATTQVRRGQLDQQVPVHYFLFKDEITELSENFNDMAARLKELYSGMEELVDERTKELLDERKKLQEALRELAATRDQAVSANQTKSEFVSVVSHELKIPMTSIKGYSDLMLSGMTGELSQQQRDFLNTIRSNVQRMTTLVNDLTDISRIETGNLRVEPSAVDLCQVIDEVVASTQNQFAARSQTLETDVPDNLPEIWCDRNRLAQILTNLISNANKYTPYNGNVKVSAALTQYRRDGRTRDMVRVAVRDNGLGISPAEQKKLFQKFFRSDDLRAREAPGTGLGLNITKSLIEMQEGEIWFESELDKGTTFFFTLPVHEN